ncbi:MAG: hypothetical protein ACREJ9_11115 [Candidatus Rokuibacteriota bacterium]
MGGQFNADDFLRKLSPPRIVESGPTGLAIEWTYMGRKVYRLFLHETMRVMNREAILPALETSSAEYVLFRGRDGFARLGPVSAVAPAGGDGITAGARMFVEELWDPSTEASSWFDLATFFLAREIREVVRGDILETRAKMAQRGYRRVWIEAVTAVEIARSLGGSWSAVLRDLVSVIKRMFGT